MCKRGIFGIANINYQFTIGNVIILLLFLKNYNLISKSCNYLALYRPKVLNRSILEEFIRIGFDLLAVFFYTV